MTKEKLENHLNNNLSFGKIAKLEGLSAATVKYWANKYNLKSPFKSFSGGFYEGNKAEDIRKPVPCEHLERESWSNEKKKSFSYIFGFYLSSGVLTKVRETGRSFLLSLVCREEYIKIHQKLLNVMRVFFPNPPKVVKRSSGKSVCINTSAIDLDHLFPSGKGIKKNRGIVLSDWQIDLIKDFPIQFISGMMDSGVKKIISGYQFEDKSETIHSIFREALNLCSLTFSTGIISFKTPIFLTIFEKQDSISFIEKNIIIKPDLVKSVMSDESKKVISIKRKDWLAKNPDKHPWKNPDKANSPPCENVKRILRLKEIDFIPEFSPGVEGRFFSVDIAFPDRQIIWEINGNQHYEKDGSLKPYYQERHDLLVADGWTVYEIPSKYCFNEEKIAEFIYLSFNSPIKIDFDYFSYIAPEGDKVKCPNCGGGKSRYSLQCGECKRLSDRTVGRKPVEERSKKSKKKGSKPSHPRFSPCPICGQGKSIVSECCQNCNNKKDKPKKIEWPTLDEMRFLVFSIPASQLSLKLGVSDSAIGKFCKTHGIEKPGRGYWAKERSGIGTQN